MAVNSWTREENKQFKYALMRFSAFESSRFEKIAAHVQKPVAAVKAHYERLVADLLEIGSSLKGVPGYLAEAMAQNRYPVDRALWIKDEHEWFLIGLNRFWRDWEKIAELVESKDPMQIKVYAYHFCRWQKSKKKVKKQRRANDITMVGMNVDGQQGSLAQPDP